MKKVLSLIFVLLLTVPLIASCSGGGNRPEGTENASGTVGTAATESAGPETENYAMIDEYVDDLVSSVNFKGWTFTFIAKEDSWNRPLKEEETGVTESDAVYYRQRDIEELFGIDIDYVTTENGDITADQVKNEVMAGGAAYDLA